MKRFFTSQPLGNDIELNGAEHNHLAHVLRTQIGENVIVCNGDDFDYSYNVANITKSVTTLSFVSKSINISNPQYNVAVFMASIKPDRLHTAITMLNEIGVSELVIFPADRSNTPLKSLNPEKLNEIARQSCKQCARSRPLCVRLTSSAPVVALKNFSQIFLADENLSPQTPNPNFTNHISKPVAIIIGPEGGFTPSERTKLHKVPNITPITLGPRILRAETAAVVAATMILAPVLGDVQ